MSLWRETTCPCTTKSSLARNLCELALHSGRTLLSRPARPAVAEMILGLNGGGDAIVGLGDCAARVDLLR